MEARAADFAPAGGGGTRILRRRLRVLAVPPGEEVIAASLCLDWATGSSHVLASVTGLPELPVGTGGHVEVHLAAVYAALAHGR